MLRIYVSIYLGKPLSKNPRLYPYLIFTAALWLHFSVWTPRAEEAWRGRHTVLLSKKVALISYREHKFCLGAHEINSVGMRNLTKIVLWICNVFSLQETIQRILRLR